MSNPPKDYSWTPAKLLHTSDVRAVLPVTALILMYGPNLVSMHLGVLASAFVLKNVVSYGKEEKNRRDAQAALEKAALEEKKESNPVKADPGNTQEESKADKAVKLADAFSTVLYERLVSFYLGYALNDLIYSNLKGSKADWASLPANALIDVIENREWHGDSFSLKSTDVKSTGFDFLVTSICNLSVILAMKFIPGISAVPVWVPVGSVPYILILSGVHNYKHMCENEEKWLKEAIQKHLQDEPKQKVDNVPVENDKPAEQSVVTPTPKDEEVYVDLETEADDETLSEKQKKGEQKAKQSYDPEAFDKALKDSAMTMPKFGALFGGSIGFSAAFLMGPLIARFIVQYAIPRDAASVLNNPLIEGMAIAMLRSLWQTGLKYFSMYGKAMDMGTKFIKEDVSKELYDLYIHHKEAGEHVAKLKAEPAETDLRATQAVTT